MKAETTGFKETKKTNVEVWITIMTQRIMTSQLSETDHNLIENSIIGTKLPSVFTKLK